MHYWSNEVYHLTTAIDEVGRILGCLNSHLVNSLHKAQFPGTVTNASTMHRDRYLGRSFHIWFDLKRTDIPVHCTVIIEGAGKSWFLEFVCKILEFFLSNPSRQWRWGFKKVNDLHTRRSNKIRLSDREELLHNCIIIVTSEWLFCSPRFLH